MMHIEDKPRIRWACRRGMLELDVIIMPFFNNDYDGLDNEDKKRFICLLQNDDPDLFNWLMSHDNPVDKDMQRIVRLIQQRNRQRGSLAG